MNIQYQSTLKETYLAGIVLLKNWLDKATIAQDTEAQACFQRMLDTAVEKFHKKFPEYKLN